MQPITVASMILVLSWPVISASSPQEARDHYKRWLQEDVLYIITPEEREVFSKLSRDEEREQFIEQFWRRRDPDPQTPLNEYKEEHYRRIAYANAHFTSGFPGWKTDRGMIYIKFGPPDRKEVHPTGGHYTRPSWEGGGSTTTYPFEQWEYRFLEGVGPDVEIEFVDDSLSGEYRLATHADEKDALLRTPNAGLTDAEMMGLVEQKLDRIVRKTNPMPGHNPLVAGRGRVKDQPFEKLQLLSSLEKPPSIDLSGLKAKVAARVLFEQFPFQVRSDVFQGPGPEEHVLLTFYIRNRDLVFEKSEHGYAARVELYGVVRNLSGRIVQEIEDRLLTRIPESEYAAGSDEIMVSQRRFRLAPGRYKLELHARDAVGDKLSSSESLLLVPDSGNGELSVSSFMLARRIQAMPSASSDSKITQYKIWPLTDQKVPALLQKLGLYFEIYNLEKDGVSSRPHLDVSYEIVDADGAIQKGQPEVHALDYTGNGVAVMSILPTQKLERGSYTLRVTLEDTISGKRLVRPVPFILQ